MPGQPTVAAAAQLRPEQRRAVADLMRELGDPVRIAVIDLLSRGPRTAAELAGELAIASPRLANHLGRLRAAGLVSVTRSGRHAIYRLADPRAAAALATLATLVAARPAVSALPSAGGQAATPPAGPPGSSGRALAQARTCYDHLAGRLGVAVFDHLVAAGALRAPRVADGSEITLGPAAAAGFAALGVDITAPLPRRRKPAVSCLDWTERRPHLGGALGAAVLGAALARGWVRETGTRTLTITDAGRAGLPLPPAATGRSR